MSAQSQPEPSNSADTREFNTPDAAGVEGITWADESGPTTGGSTWFDDLAKAGAEAEAAAEAGVGSRPGSQDGLEPPAPSATGDATEILDQADLEAAMAETQPLGEDVIGVAAPPGGDLADPESDGAHGELARLSEERDQYLETSQRLQAELSNYRKVVAKREVESRERANEALVDQLLPVLDACDAALASGSTDVGPVRSVLFDVLSKQGLERIGFDGEPFDPARHEAVAHEPADGGSGPSVAALLRAGYSWKGRVLRPAMVKVRG